MFLAIIFVICIQSHFYFISLNIHADYLKLTIVKAHQRSCAEYHRGTLTNYYTEDCNLTHSFVENFEMSTILSLSFVM